MTATAENTYRIEIDCTNPSHAAFGHEPAVITAVSAATALDELRDVLKALNGSSQAPSLESIEALKEGESVSMTSDDFSVELFA